MAAKDEERVSGARGGPLEAYGDRGKEGPLTNHGRFFNEHPVFCKELSALGEVVVGVTPS